MLPRAEGCGEARGGRGVARRQKAVQRLAPSEGCPDHRPVLRGAHANPSVASCPGDPCRLFFRRPRLRPRPSPRGNPKAVVHRRGSEEGCAEPEAAHLVRDQPRQPAASPPLDALSSPPAEGARRHRGRHRGRERGAGRGGPPSRLLALLLAVVPEGRVVGRRLPLRRQPKLQHRPPDGGHLRHG